MKKALLAYNPKSGSQFLSQNLDYIVESFKQLGVILELYRIDKDEDLIEYVQKTDADFIVGSGGDGTIGQVIASMLHYKVDKPFMALGMGTSNNFTRNIEDTKSITSEEQARQIIIDAYQGMLEKFDIGLVNEKMIFLTSLAGGNFIDTSFETDKKLKSVLGGLAYYIKPLADLTNVKSYDIKVTVDGKVYQERIVVFVIVNGSAVGNFDNFVNDADMSDGVMELVLIKEASAFENLSLVGTIAKGEDVTELENVVVIKGKDFLIECDEQMPISLDGERGPELPIRAKVVPQAISVMVAQQNIEE